MQQELIDMAIQQEGEGKAKWGHIDHAPTDLMIAITEEIGEVAHAINHSEGSPAIKQEIAEVVGLLSRLYDMS